MRRTLIGFLLVAMSVGLPRAIAQDNEQDQQQQQPGPDNVDPNAAAETVQAAEAVLEAAAADRAAQDAQQQMGGDQQFTGPATQPAMEEQPDNRGQPGPTSRPVRRNNGMQASRPRRYSTTRPTFTARSTARPTPPKTVDTEFAMLMSRSIFKKGEQHTDVITGKGGPSTRPTDPTFPPEHSLIFNGLTESDTTTALVEDTAAHKIDKLHVGDAIASGKITRIDFDTLDYTANGKTLKITIGQNFEGSAAAPTSGPADYSASGGTGTSSSGGGGDSILEKMRKRRLEGK